MRKQILTLIILSAMFTLSGCSDERSSVKDFSSELSFDDTVSTEVTAEEIITTEETSTEITTEEIITTEEVTTTPAPAEIIPQTFKSVLEGIYYDYTFPEIGTIDSEYCYDMEENEFAIYDVDRDGKDELIFLYTSSASASMFGTIYGFDDNGEIIMELEEFPAFTFYENGIIEVGLSHNQGLAGDFWPYTMYKYDSESNLYYKVGFVDAWDKSYTDVDFYRDNAPYPEDIDTSGTGFVYYIYPTDNDTMDILPVDVTEYNSWHDSFVEGTPEIEMPFLNMTEENIQSIE